MVGAAGAEPTLFVNPRWAQAEADFSLCPHADVISSSDVAAGVSLVSLHLPPAPLRTLLQGVAGGRYAARAEVSAWAGYEPTPLVELPQLAEEFGVDSLRCKHEGHRFEPVGSFKPTGVVYALARVLLAEVGQPVPERGGSAADLLLTGDYTEQLAGVTGACVFV